MSTRHWYRIALARSAGAPQLVAASGEHMGQAIDNAQRAVHGSWAVAIEHATGGEIPLGESGGLVHVVAPGAAPGDLPAFRWPTGVLPELGGAAAVAGARRGVVERKDPRLFVLEAQPDAEQLVDLFLGLIERLPAADNLEVRVLDHFEDAGTTDVWLTSRTNARKIVSFLDDHDVELLANGHVEISIYLRAQAATLRLTEHKTVVFLSDNRDLEADLAGWLGELHIPRVESLVTVRDAPHFHYRAAKSKDRKKLGEELFRERLRKVDTVRRA